MHVRPLALLAVLAVVQPARPHVAAAASAVAPEGRSETPRLVLQITVDQLRGDLLARHRAQLGQGGFRLLLDRGVVHADAHHGHANTETIVGHATLATGAHPAVHGMIGNAWFDRESGVTTYNIEDGRYRLLTTGGGVDAKTEIDPTQKAARSDGRSPSAIQVSTFSDELALHSAGKAKVFAVSVKDRGAVSMAGHAGTAYWFSKAAGEFVTSTYYLKEYPPWVLQWNAERRPAEYAGTEWNLLADRSTYLFRDADDRPWETDLAGFGRVFPHRYPAADSKYLTTLLTTSPAGDRLTADFARTLIEAEGLGRDDVPDYLAVSFSSTDYVGHLFSPSSLEAEDNLLRLDRVLADLLAFVDAKVGLARTLVILSADHGGPEAPGYLQQLGLEAFYVDPASWNTEPGIAALRGRFGAGRELIRAYEHPYVYLDQDLIREKGLDAADVERAVAAEIVKLHGVAFAVSSADLREGRLPNTPINQAVLNNFHPKRSGDVFVVFEPHCFLNDFDGLTVASTHGSPWTYDTHVPVIFAGAGISPQIVYRRIETVDVAATLAAFMGTKPPSGCVGRVLEEVLAKHAPSP